MSIWNVNHSFVASSTTHSLKANLLCAFLLLVGMVSAFAQSQTSAPYETNCVVTIGPNNCGNLGVYPCWIKYDLTVKDDTPGAAINYRIWEGPAPFTSGQVIPGSSGAHIIVTSHYGDTYFTSGFNGNMTATASGHTISNQVSLSF